MGKRLNLFAGDDDADPTHVTSIEIDKDFARRYEHNKKREDLHRYEELKKQGRIDGHHSNSPSDSHSDSDTSVDEDVFNHSKKKDIEFFENLMKVRNRDPAVYRKPKLFDSDSEDDSDNDNEDDSNDASNKKQKKKMYLKDVVAKQLIEEGPEFEEIEDGNDFKRKMSYNQEQEELRKQFLDAVSNAEDDERDDFLKVKDQNGKGDGDNRDNGEFEKKLNEYFGREDGELDENKMFLKQFFMNKMWIDNGDSKDAVVDDDEVDELLEDEEEIERQEKYEETYNFRHEENAGDRVMGHSRKVEGSVRKKDNARKEQRKSKEDRMKIAEMERKEELKHWKNLKKQEMRERMKKVMEAAGIKDDYSCLLDLDDLEEDFDPEEYDKMMKKAFDDKYYDAEDVDPEFGSDYDEDGVDVEKPDFDKEDELLGLLTGWDEVKSDGGFHAAREIVLKRKADNDGSHDEDGTEGEFEEEEVDEGRDNGEGKNEESKRKRKSKLSLVKKAKEELMEEYYKLDYEDTVGDLKTRFKYTKVNPSKYGLKTEEILWMDDRDLNQYVSIKKLAPYREKEWKVPKVKKHLFKKGLHERQEKPNDKKRSKKSIPSKDGGETSASVLNSDEDGKTEMKGSVDTSNLSKKAKRKLRQKEFKLPHTRQLAYLQIQPKLRRKRNADASKASL